MNKNFMLRYKNQGRKAPEYSVMQKCSSCRKSSVCKLNVNGFSDLCKVSTERGLPLPFNYEWESELDVKMSPEHEEGKALPHDALKKDLVKFVECDSEHGRKVEIFEYYETGEKVKKRVKGYAEIVPLERQEFKDKTIFPERFPEPLMCEEFCDSHGNCRLRETGFDELCKFHARLGKLVKKHSERFRKEEHEPVIWVKSSARSVYVDDYESNWRTDRNGEYTHYVDPRLVPEIALSHWGSSDSEMTEPEFESSDLKDDVRQIGDKTAVRFIPQFIFAPAKPVWHSIVKCEGKGIPYLKLIKYPSIKPVACRVELRGGYVVPLGHVANTLKIITKADKKRLRDYSATVKELKPFVGEERAKDMARRKMASV